MYTNLTYMTVIAEGEGRLEPMGYKEMSSILAVQWAPLYMRPNAGGGGLLRGLSQ
jgi:hypothetical protein